MVRSGALAVLLSLLGGCGLAETGVTAAAGANSAAQQAAAAKQTEDQVKQQLDHLKKLHAALKSKSSNKIATTLTERFARATAS